jgi:hypothetical protein
VFLGFAVSEMWCRDVTSRNRNGLGVSDLQSKLKQFGNEKFYFAGIAHSQHQLKTLESKSKKDGFQFRYLWNGTAWIIYRKKKKKQRKAVKMD